MARASRRAAALALAIGTVAPSAGAPSARACLAPALRDGIVRQAAMLGDMNGFAAVAGTTGGLGRRFVMVDRADDTPDRGTLRWAVAQARGAGGGWIGFAPTLAGRDIRLASPIRLPANVTVDGGITPPTLIGAPGQTILVITRVSNVVVANLTLRSDLASAAYKGDGDCITVAHGADRVWIAHNLIGRCGDGQLDITRNGEPGPMRVTVAFNHFTAHDKVSIVQGDDDPGACGGPSGTMPTPLEVTFYRNFFDGTGQRHPRAGGAAYVHWVENVVHFRQQARALTQQGGAYGGAVTDGATMLVERSLYRADADAGRVFRFIDTRGVPAHPGACAVAGRLRLRQVVTEPAAPVAENEAGAVPNPPYTLPAPDGHAGLQSLFAEVSASAGPLCAAATR